MITFFLSHGQRLRLASLALLAFGISCHAQTDPSIPPPKAVLFQTLALGIPVSELFYDLKGKPVQIQAGVAELSRLYETDADRSVSIYRLVPSPDPATPPQRVTLAKLSLSENHPHLLLLTGAAKASDIKVNILEDSWKMHPEKTFRIINHSKRNIAVQLGAEERMISSGQDWVFLSIGAGYDFDFKMASWEDGRWTLRVLAPQSILPRTRAFIVVSDPFPTPQDPNPVDLNMVTVFDAKQLTK
jgi:hypothetical protein